MVFVSKYYLILMYSHWDTLSLFYRNEYSYLTTMNREFFIKLDCLHNYASSSFSIENIY